VDDIVPLAGNSLINAVRALRRKPRFDVGVLFPNSLRSALEVSLSGIPRKVGYRGHARIWLLNQVVRKPRRPGPPEHHATRFLRIADDCGADVDLVRDAKQVLSETSHVQDQKWLGLCPGAEYGPAKRWLPERFAEAAVAVSAQSKVKWILFGVNNDESIGETIASALGENCINRIGQTTLDQLIEELRRCRLLLTNDTGTMHLAALDRKST